MVFCRPFLTFLRPYRLECFCFLLFTLLAVLGFCVHEPGFDEAQAWQIAKTASYQDILWIIPLDEGHPPFWHLLLSIPAKLGLSWKLSTSFLGLACMLSCAFILFFKAPFPKWVRCLLPFNFFLFYQYGIVVRPYALILLFILLLAYFFPLKDKKPGLFVALLAGLCACHLYGIAIAGGITLAWLWEMKGSLPFKTFLPGLLKDKRFHYLLGLLGFVLAIVLIITFPRGGHFLEPTHPVSWLQQIIYVFLAIPADAVLTNLNTDVRTTITSLPWMPLLGTSLVGMGLWAITLLTLPKKNIGYLILPYLFMGIVLVCYSSCHHIGLALLLFVWYFWINLAQGPVKINWPAPFKKLAQCLLALVLIVPVWWGIGTLYLDYKIVTFPGKEMVAFLKKYNLIDQVIFSDWTAQWDMANQVYYWAPESQPISVITNMYLDHNRIANFHHGAPIGYAFNQTLSTNHEKTAQQWRGKGIPGVLLNLALIEWLFEEPNLLTHYRLAFAGEGRRLWKANAKSPTPANIYIHESLWEKYGPQILADNTNKQKGLH